MSDNADEGWAVAGSGGRRGGGRSGGGGNQRGGQQPQQGGSFGRGGSQNQSRGGGGGFNSRGGGSGGSSNYQSQQQRSYGGGQSSGSYGGRGGGRSSHTTFEARDKIVPQIDRRPFSANKLGWTHLPENKEEIKLPVSKGPGQHCRGFSEVYTNHFPAPINLPGQIFHYEVNIIRKGKTSAPTPAKAANKTSSTEEVSKKLNQMDLNLKEDTKLPSELRLGIIKQYIKELEQEYASRNPKVNPRIKLISDFSNTLNAYVNLMDSKVQKEINIRSIPNYDSTMGDGIFIVSLKETQGNFKTNELRPHMNDLRTLPEKLEEDYSLTRVEQVYNTMLKNIGGDSYIPAGRSSMIKIPSEGQKRNEIGNGLEALEGASVIYNMGWKPTVNIDLQHRPFIMNLRVGKYLEENGLRNVFKDSREWGDQEISTARRVLKGIKVIYDIGINHLPRGGTVVDIAQKDARNTKFLKNGKQTSVEEHFMNEFKIKLRNPTAICLRLSKDNVVPLELCTIKKGQSFNKKLEAEQTSEIMRYSRNNPTELKAKIDNEVKSLKIATDETLKAFGATFDTKPIMFTKTRIITPPKIIYGGNGPNTVGCVTPNDGTWELGNLKFFQPARTKAWGMISLSNIDNSTWNRFETDFVKMAGERGLDIGQKKYQAFGTGITERTSSAENIKKLTQIFKEAKDKGVDFLVVVIPKKGSCIYDQVKVAAEIKVGIVTQCIASTNIEKYNGSKIANILLKVNMKLNGINNLISIPSDASKQLDFNKIPCLFLGADVTHPPPEHGVKPGWTPSFAAVTANILHTGLPTAMRIQAQVKPDKGAAEVVHNLDKIVGEFLTEYKANMKFLPLKIVFFRDGVGEGQFKEVLDVEMRSIRKACSKYNLADGQKYEPEITFIVVQKRHKTRAYCSIYKDGKLTGFKNCDAGTVIDKDIVHRKDEDFYMFSHKGMLGTSRSTHYRTIWDDSNMTMDQIQAMAYNLCYLYSRCNRAVRVPAPALYAHLAASRAKVLFEANKIVPPSEAREFDGRVNPLDETENAKIQYINEINEKLMIQEAFRRQYPMHFV